MIIDIFTLSSLNRSILTWMIVLRLVVELPRHAVVRCIWLIQSVSYLTWKHCTSIKSEFNQCHDRIRIKFWIKFNLINHVTSDCSNMQFQCHPSRILTTELCTNNLTCRHSALNRKYSQVLIIIPSRWTLHDLFITLDDSSNDLRST